MRSRDPDELPRVLTKWYKFRRDREVRTTLSKEPLSTLVKTDHRSFAGGMVEEPVAEPDPTLLNDVDLTLKSVEVVRRIELSRTNSVRPD